MQKGLLIGLLFALTNITTVQATEAPELMRVTCYYTSSGVTASGTKPKPNYSCGARRDLIGSIALVYEDDGGKPGAFVGMYSIEDTGGAPRIQSGKSIDIYQNTLKDCKEYIKAHGDYQWVQIVKGDG